MFIYCANMSTLHGKYLLNTNEKYVTYDKINKILDGLV